jgi:hypothetical protein
MCYFSINQIISWRFWGFDFLETLLVHIAFYFHKTMVGEIDTTSIEPVRVGVSLFDDKGDSDKFLPARNKVRLESN